MPAPEKGKSEQDFPFSGAAPSARFDPLRSNAKGDSHPLSRSPHADLKAGSDLDCLGAPRRGALRSHNKGQVRRLVLCCVRSKVPLYGSAASPKTKYDRIAKGPV